METVAIRRHGFAIRFPFDDFIKRSVLEYICPHIGTSAHGTWVGASACTRAVNVGMSQTRGSGIRDLCDWVAILWKNEHHYLTTIDKRLVCMINYNCSPTCWKWTEVDKFSANAAALCELRCILNAEYNSRRPHTSQLFSSINYGTGKLFWYLKVPV